MIDNLKCIKLLAYTIVILSILIITKDVTATNTVILIGILSEICLKK